MNIKPHIIKILATATMSVTAVSVASADEFESLYNRPGVSVVRLYPPMLSGLDIDEWNVGGKTDYVTQRLDNMVVLSAEKSVVNADFGKLSNDIQRIIDSIRPEPQIMMQVIDEGERTTIYGQTVSGDTSKQEFSRIIIFSNSGDEINLINIDGSITVNQE